MSHENVTVIRINMPDRFVDDPESNNAIDDIAYQATLNIVEQLEEQGFIQKHDDPNYNVDDPGCIVEYSDYNGEYDRPGQ
jgi:hypothetical protein